MKTPAVVLFSIIAFTLAACSAKVSDPFGDLPGGGVPQKPDVFSEPAIQGPAVLGVWQTGCVTADVYRGSRKATIEYVDISNFKYTNVKYSDSSCQTVSSTGSHAGLYQFSKKESDSSYVIDYNYLVDKVTYKMNGQHLELAGDTLYISEFVFGNTNVTHTVPFKKSASGGATPAPVPAPAPGGCASYVGTYQMNSDYFSIAQSACSELTWVYQTSDGPETYKYMADGQSRAIGNTMMAASFNEQGQFTKSYSASGIGQVLEVWSFSKTPCHLANPDGSVHLTRDVYVDGRYSDTYCKFWDKR